MCVKRFYISAMCPVYWKLSSMYTSLGERRVNGLFLMCIIGHPMTVYTPSYKDDEDTDVEDME